MNNSIGTFTVVQNVWAGEGAENVGLEAKFGGISSSQTGTGKSPRRKEQFGVTASACTDSPSPSARLFLELHQHAGSNGHFLAL